MHFVKAKRQIFKYLMSVDKMYKIIKKEKKKNRHAVQRKDTRNYLQTKQNGSISAVRWG